MINDTKKYRIKGFVIAVSTKINGNHKSISGAIGDNGVIVIDNHIFDKNNKNTYKVAMSSTLDSDIEYAYAQSICITKCFEVYESLL